MLIDQTSVTLALIGLSATLLNGVFNTVAAWMRHKETMGQLRQVNENVNGKMDKLLTVTGDAREAIGKLKGEKGD